MKLSEVECVPTVACRSETFTDPFLQYTATCQVCVRKYMRLQIPTSSNNIAANITVFERKQSIFYFAGDSFMCRSVALLFIDRMGMCLPCFLVSYELMQMFDSFQGNLNGYAMHSIRNFTFHHSKVNH